MSMIRSRRPDKKHKATGYKKTEARKEKEGRRESEEKKSTFKPQKPPNFAFRACLNFAS